MGPALQPDNKLLLVLGLWSNADAQALIDRPGGLPDTFVKVRTVAGNCYRNEKYAGGVEHTLTLLTLLLYINRRTLVIADLKGCRRPDGGCLSPVPTSILV